jgi:hypothetical protein
MDEIYTYRYIYLTFSLETSVLYFPAKYYFVYPNLVTTNELQGYVHT